MILSKKNIILPALVFIVLAAFSFRLVEVFTGISSLVIPARAEVAKEDPFSGFGEALIQTIEPRAGDKKESGKHTSSEKNASDDHEEKTAMSHDHDDESSDAEIPVWLDSSDSDMQNESVRMEILQDMAERRKKMDGREKSIMTREALLEATEKELDRKYQELAQLREEIERLLEQQSEEEQQRIASLVKVYEGMKPKDSARIFDTLDLDILVAVMSRMSERRISPIMAAMNPERARTVTILLAEQKQLPSLPQH